MLLANSVPHIFLPDQRPRAACGSQLSDAEKVSAERRFIDQYAFEHGRTYDSYLMIEDDRDYFWSGDRSSVIGYVKWGRCLHVTGNLTAPEHRREELLQEFKSFSEQKSCSICVYNVFDEDIPLFDRHGFQVTKWGEEPIVDLRETNWEGKSYEWVRRQENYCRRQGATLREINATPADPEFCRLVPELLEVNRQHLKTTPQGKEMCVVEGRFTPENFGRRRLFIAERRGRIEAFLVLNPALAGRIWAIEMYRRRLDAPQGIIPFGMMQAMRRLKEEGTEFVSLSLVPGLRTDRKRPGDSRLFRRGVAFWRSHLSWLFDMNGLYHYKSRFRPRYRNAYVAAYPRQTLSSLISLIMTWGVLNLEPRCFSNVLYSHIKNRKFRQDISRPARSQEKVFSPHLLGASLRAGSEPAVA